MLYRTKDSGIVLMEWTTQSPELYEYFPGATYLLQKMYDDDYRNSTSKFTHTVPTEELTGMRCARLDNFNADSHCFGLREPLAWASPNLAIKEQRLQI